MDKRVDINQEIEIKLDLGSFVNYLKLTGSLGQVDEEIHHQNAFYDTSERAISEAGWALRVRVETARGLITLKSAATAPGPAAVRSEIEGEIDRSTAMAILSGETDLMTLHTRPVAFLKDNMGDLAVTELVRFSNERKRKNHRLGDYAYCLEIDRTEYRDGSVDYELEVELPDVSRVEQAEHGLQRLFASLDIPYAIQTESKFARALARAGLS